MRKYYLISTIAACILVSCGSQKAQTTTQNLQANEAQNQTAGQNLQSAQNAKKQKDLSFENTKWVLKTVDGKEFKQGMIVAYIIFKEDRVSGSSGCNKFGGTYYLSGDILKISDAIVTQRLCADENPERLFFSVLQRTDACLVVGNKLIITQMGNEIATFEGTEN